ncbi:MFS transporter [Paenibacillus sp. PsM32]|uniref:MFS transporter n=1 Tax=Paenibacillus kyungheensis TaxID=1452732 RepID=A0AAX3M475_9BACL|nr:MULTISPECIES: MFS transporter [Paenibacillus]MDN4617512.1 MFS transporter [Paenibacillus sp. PsM32]MDQ1232644.1 DHA1 family multidrug resistance protein-like MFS transporter [Paenibacillus sp. SORGH_AS_0306]MDR6109694.1 DHA1 family multidrug resistance protein-like MFS transporter [Paenibacillus sp. SORGH_AS_0338]WCT56677.1 MFS transporter [Paenibacillus kyungheensis]WDF50220.1 MFS transporter [Paenibacillus sp. KACC 21273]
MLLLLRNRGAILLLMINIFLIFTGVGLVIPIMPTYMNELHINGSMVGLLVAAFSLSQLICSPIAGRLSDTWGRKKMIVSGMIIFAVSEWLFGIANDPTLLFAARMLGGIGAAFIMPAVMAYTADITSDEERGKGMGYINAAITTGFIIGPGIGGYIAEFGIRVPFYAAGIAAAIAAIITLLVLPESLTAEKRKATIAEASLTKQPNMFLQLIHSYRESYFLSLVIVFVMSFGLANYETVFGLFVDHKFGFTPKDIAFIITFGSIAGAVVQVSAFGWIVNTFGEKKVISWCLVFASVFVLLTLFVNQYWMILVVTFIVFLSIDILRPAISTQLSKIAHNQQGYVAGLNSAYSSLGNIAGPIVAGLLFDINIGFPYMAAAIVLFLCFILSRNTKKLDV